MKLTIGHLYPDLLNLYGDRGNIQCMMKRLQWRGIEAETIEFEIQDEVDFSELDIVLLGGGSDREQMLVCERLKEIRDDFKAYVEDGGVVLAVCGGYQLLGTHYSTDQGVIEGLSIVDIYTEQGKDYRLIDNIVLESELSDMPVVGFENHGGRTYIKDQKPFGKVIYGSGNDGQSGYEGIIYKNVIGTYLHGPLLPKNPQICDYLLTKALERKYKKPISSLPLMIPRNVKQTLTFISGSKEKSADRRIRNRFKILLEKKLPYFFFTATSYRSFSFLVFMGFHR